MFLKFSDITAMLLILLITTSLANSDHRINSLKTGLATREVKTFFYKLCLYQQTARSISRKVRLLLNQEDSNTQET